MADMTWHEIKKLIGAIDELRAKMNQLKGQKVPTQEYRKLQEELSDTEKEYSRLLEKKKRFEETGIILPTGSWDNGGLKAAEDKIKELKAAMGELEGPDQIRVSGEASGQQMTSLLEAVDVFSKICHAAKEAFGVIQAGLSLMDGIGGRAFRSILSGGKKSGSILLAFSKKLKGIASSLSVFHWISKGFGAMVAGMKKGLSVLVSGIRKGFELMAAGMKKGLELMVSGAKKGLDVLVSSVKGGFENLLGYSDSYAQGIQGLKDALSVIGNQFAAAFAPIVQTVIPWLMSLMNVISVAAAYVAQFIAAIGGKSTFTKAKQVQDSYNKSLSGTTDAAEEAYGALAQFDDLNVLDVQTPSTGAAGAEDADHASADMFEEIPVDTEVIGCLASVLSYVGEIKDALKDGFFDGLGDVSGRFGSMKDSILSIKDTLIGIWSDSSVLSAADGWGQSVAYMLGNIAGSIASVGITIAANLLGGMELYLSQNEEGIKEYLISMFNIWEEINNQLSEWFSSLAYVFEAFGDENGQQLTANLIGLFTDAFMGASEIVSELMGDILTIITQPFIDNKEEFKTALDGYLGVLAEVTGTIKQGIDDTFGKFKEVYDEHFKPFFDSIAGGLSDTVGKFMEFWNGHVQPLLDIWAIKFDIIWKEHIQPVLDKFAELMGKVADLLKALWENRLKPMIDWVVENILPVILPIVDGAANAVMIACAVVGDMIGGIIDVIGGIIDFLVGVFTGDWKKAWNSITDVFKGIFNHIPEIVEKVLNMAIDLINGIIGGINSITGAIGIPEIPLIASVKLPRLATGAVIRGGNPFMAVLGDQPYGQTNIEAPLATIEQAVDNVLARRGNSGGGMGSVISLNVDGQEFARLTLGDMLQEMGRQGYNVNILGVN